MSLQTMLGRVFGSVRLGLEWGSRATAMLVAVGLSGVGVVGVGTALAQECDPTEIAKLLADDGAPGDGFGGSVSIDGDTAIIGVPQDDDNGNDTGSAYVFTRIDGVWTQQAKLLVAGAGAYFGGSVSLDSDTAVIGARFDDDNGGQSGSAFVFTRSGGVWTQQAKLLVGDGEVGDFFGGSVSLDGDTAVIGAVGDDDNGTRSGSAYVFTRSGGAWTQQAKLLAGDGGADDQFGSSVSIDGDTAVVGASSDKDNGTSSGSAYVFTRSGSEWTQQVKLLPDDGEGSDQFGISVSHDGDTAVIGANGDNDNGTSSGSAYVFMRNGGVWTEQAKLLAGDGEGGDFFGSSVSIHGDAAIVGAWGDNVNGSFTGSAYFFTRSGSVWTQQAKLLPGAGAGGDQFGCSVSIDGDTAAIGASADDDNGFRSGSAYVFDLACTDCPADINGDGVVNTQDFLAFLGLWSAGDPLADWNADGTINTQDFLAYLTDWVAGC